MKVYVRYERKPGDTINGEMIVVTSMYSSFDIAEMNRYENMLKGHIGSGLHYEMDLDGQSDPKNNC